jgi:2,4-dienoyl-CoA reductase-like NADH-dependent reductase (Old Yellow Enzyme family)
MTERFTLSGKTVFITGVRQEKAVNVTNQASVTSLFKPFRLKNLMLPNRIVMPAMGFHVAEGGVPGPDVAEYYRRRAEGGVGLMFTEGVYIDHPVSGNNPLLMRFSSGAALAGWAEVVRGVHSAQGLIMPELWHVGLIYRTEDVLKGGELTFRPEEKQISPSGYIMPGRKVSEGMTPRDIDDVIDSFARGAEHAVANGFDGVELHGAHGYLIDQFFWAAMNHRQDSYGGSMRDRARFGAEVVTEIRRRVGSEFPIVMRISQWKLQDYNAKVAHNPLELEQWLSPLVDAGVDAFDCSQRRYWQPEFEGSPLNFAGWVKKVSGLPSITVGSVGLDQEMLASLGQAVETKPLPLDPLILMLERGDFDLVAVGRALIADPDWPLKVLDGAMDELIPFTPAVLAGSPSHAPYARK